MRHFLRLTSPEMGPASKLSGGEAPKEERESGTVVPVGDEVELIRKAESRPCGQRESFFEPFFYTQLKFNQKSGLTECQ